MGVFDGHSSLDEEGSTAQLAKLLGAPVILVADASKVARSVAAEVLGYQQFDPGMRIAGVIPERGRRPGPLGLLQAPDRSHHRHPGVGLPAPKGDFRAAGTPPRPDSHRRGNGCPPMVWRPLLPKWKRPLT